MINASPSNHRSLYSGPRRYLSLAVFIVVGALLAFPLFVGSASSPTTPVNSSLITHKLDNSALSSHESVVRNFNFLLPQAAPPTVATFASDCTTSKTVFNVQDTDLVVCAKFTGAAPGWRVIWSNARFVAVQNTPITSANGSATFTLTTSSSLGDWRVILFEPFGGTVQAITSFTVVDDANPTADLSVSKAAVSSTASSGGQAIFSVQVTNNGPSAASAVQLSDDVPANTTFQSFAQLDGPVFNCTSPNVGETGSTVCTITSLQRGETAIFLATYQIGTVPSGTVISNTSTVTSTTTDPPNPNGADNNTSTATVDVLNTPCQLSTQENITVSADTGQAGAVVTYTTPTGTGDCGTTTTGEGGETIPAISCNPASGSFFAVGTTPVICFAQTGATTSFLVTVDNPGALSISLNGASTVTVECGDDFADPSASAINGSGASVEVTVSYTGGFNPDSPATGSYTATYTATEGANSVSTTRTINVTDTRGPSITIDGANPYKIQQGSCSPFVDPGVSALDACAGPKPVTTSISGPGGATSVNTGIAGTYTVTYTATDGTNQSTATRTVVVGTFPEDEVDQPGTSNVPPTITLNGDDQITLECGNGFTDPGATATVCGSPVTVTTTGTVNPNAPGTYTINYSATANGFTTEATRIVTVQDTVAPVITLNGANPMVVGFGTVFTDPGATASDGCAGNLTSAIVVTGSVNTNVVGFYALTYTVSDPSGHSDTKVRTVEVSPYNFTGFFAPIDNLPVVNQVNSGQSIPIKFSLGGNQGMNIFAAGSPSSVQINCNTNDPISDVEEIETPGSSGLTYDAGSNQYKYVWKTEKSWKNTCRMLTLTLRDGTVHTAKFKFK
ncbi:MAG TPA: immunoglobulin-like domain-containing protein [Pyrinomonadaceae bacterium]|nr:immunoglobulin-like domain-containing protein [Pyrinomonadaceae bacterium]